MPAGIAARFQAGQYLRIKLPHKMCPFSIASPPGITDRIELHIRPTPNSKDSDDIMALLDRASQIEIEMPLGDCILTTPPAGPLLLIAAGTGITQMKSMLEHVLPMGITSPVYLYWGVVNRRDMYLADLCESWRAQYARFHFIPVVSDPEACASDDPWRGKTGLVGEVALADLKDVSNIRVYVSGGPAMVYATLECFMAAGMPKSNMYSDVFSYAPRTL